MYNKTKCAGVDIKLSRLCKCLQKIMYFTMMSTSIDIKARERNKRQPSSHIYAQIAKKVKLICQLICEKRYDAILPYILYSETHSSGYVR